jgi:hypothetical protein
VYLTLWVDERLGLEASAGMRRGLRTSGPHGAVEAEAIVVRTEAALALLPRDRVFGLLLKLGPMFSSVQLKGVAASTTSRGREGAGIAVHGRGTLQLSVRPWPVLGCTLEVGAGLPLRAIEATDDGETVVSTGGLELHGSAGLEARF